MESGIFIKINGNKYMAFLSNNAKDTFIKSKIAAIEILKKYATSEFTKKGVCHYEKVKDINVCILTIKAYDPEQDLNVNCFIVNTLGNYTQIEPLFLKQNKEEKNIKTNKWKVKLDCGHTSIIDESVDNMENGHKIKCFKCKEKI